MDSGVRVQRPTHPLWRRQWNRGWGDVEGAADCRRTDVVRGLVITNHAVRFGIVSADEMTGQRNGGTIPSQGRSLAAIRRQDGFTRARGQPRRLPLSVDEFVRFDCGGLPSPQGRVIVVVRANSLRVRAMPANAVPQERIAQRLWRPASADLFTLALIAIDQRRGAVQQLDSTVRLEPLAPSRAISDTDLARGLPHSGNAVGQRRAACRTWMISTASSVTR